MEEIIKFVSENSIYETEYDGRMESYYFFCGKYQDNRYGHGEDCLHLKAIEILKKK